MIHCYPGSPPGRMENSHPRHIEKVVRVFHKTTFVIAHLGGRAWFSLTPGLAHEHVYFDTSGVLAELRAFYSAEQIRAVLGEIGYERIVFGSDFPEEIAPQLALLREIIPAEHHEAVLAGNIRKVGGRHGWWA